MVLIVLVLVWAAVLVPLGLRRLSDRQAISSVIIFRDALRHLSGSRGIGEVRDNRLTPEPVSNTAGSVVLDGTSRARRRRTLERRRRTIGIFGLTLLGTFTFGAIPALRPLWYLSLVTLILGVCYLALLVFVVREEQASAERRTKVVVMPTRQAILGPTHTLPSAVRAVGSAYAEMPPLRPAFRILEHPLAR